MSPGSVINYDGPGHPLAKLPPTTATGPPSRRRLMPARIRHSTAADGASSSSISRIKIAEELGNSHGSGSSKPPGNAKRMRPACSPGEGSRNAAGALRDPEFQQPLEAGNQEQTDGGKRPSSEAPAGRKGNYGRQRRAAGTHRCDRVADPV